MERREAQGPSHGALQDQTKIGVLAGSLVCAVAGWAVLRFGSAPADKARKASG